MIIILGVRLKQEKMQEDIKDDLARLESGDLPKEAAVELLARLRRAIKEDPKSGKELGKFISLVDKVIKAENEHTLLSLQPIAGGHIAIGHKPGGKLPYAGLKKTGVTVILTLLQEHEGAPGIGGQVIKEGMQWIWFPFSASNPHGSEKASMVVELFQQLQALLEAGNQIYIHCSAGIHRTGMISYGLLRYLGNNALEARAILKELRNVTASQVGEERLEWGDQFGT